ncbi:MAG: copper homeostasis periplasmic binding protein CopC [Bradyrhizobium sp.]|nr:copper homeostasis periplasmic binding protein CopC [Bradyrhizobium sp.]MDE2603047.1 copper homeostasis periplasmic binding protein CopC [Bradyrhizobium sp.]
MPRKTILTTLAIVIAGFVSAVAYAHPVLEATDPGQGATVASPKEIRLTFTEDLIAKFSGLAVKDQGGHLVETAGPSVDPSHKSQLIVPISKPLSPGSYDVDWHAVSVDTHKVSGHFSFKVAQ